MKADKPVLWIVCEVYYPELTSTGYYLTAIAEHLAGERTVKVICGQPNYGNRGTIAPRHEVHNGVEIFRISSTTFDRSRTLNRLVNMLTLGVSAFWNALRRFRRGDRVLVVTTPPSLPYPIAMASLLTGCEYSVLVHDAYPEQLVAVGALSARSAPVKALDVLNRWLYKHAARVIVVGRDMEELLNKKAAGLDLPVIGIPNWAETADIAPSPRSENALLRRLGLVDKFVFLAAGNLGWPTDIESLIAAADALRDDPVIHILVVGGGVKMRRAEEKVETLGLRNVTLTGPLPREDQSTFLNACDVGVVTLVPGMRGAAVPSRLYNLLAAGKPLLALIDEGSEVDRVIREEGIGWSVSSRDPAEVVSVIREIYASRDRLPEMGARARSAALNKYSPEQALAAYNEALPN